MKALVIAEHAHVVSELAAGARSLADVVIVISFGEVVEGIADKTVRVSVPEGSLIEDAAATVISVFDAEAPSVVLFEPTRRMKAIAGKVAAHANTSVITDVIEFGDIGAKNLYFGGVAERIQKPLGSVCFYTPGAGVFADAIPSGTNVVEDVAWVAPAKPIELLDRKPIKKSGVDLHKADAVVAVGRGFTEEANLTLAYALVEKLQGGLACSRPLTEGVNWLSSELYVGVSGLMLSPKVYVAVGISGQMQHMVGCNRATTLFAINKDKNAPVFKQCDYGLVGDIKSILPALVSAL